MTLRRSVGVAMFAGLVMLLGLRPLYAARLEKIDEQISKDQTVPQSFVPHGSPLTCDSSATASLFASVDVAMRSALIEATATASAQSQDPGCGPLSATAFGLASITFGIVADPGENPGDSVTLCRLAAFRQGANSTSGYTADSTVSGNPLTDPAQIVLNPMGTPVVVFSVGPRTFNSGGTTDHPPPEEFVAHVGDTILIEAGAFAQATGSGGVGNANAETFSMLQFSLDACPANAPAVSHPGLGVIGLLLVGLGGLALRRRERRRRTHHPTLA